MARPRKPAEELRTRRISVRVTEAEYAEISGNAAHHSEDTSSFLRRRGLHVDASRNRSVKEDRVHRQIIHVLNNLNQLAELADDGIISGADDIHHAIEQVRATYQRLDRREIQGKRMKLTRRIVDRINTDGVLLNSLTRRAHSGREIDTADLQALLGKMIAAIRAIEGGG